jgi:type VI protein secretion system component VasF
VLWQSIRATKNDLSDGDNLPEGLSLEIRKFEVRLREYVEAEEKAAESLKTLIEKLKQLNSFMETLPTEKNSEMLDRIMELRLQAIKAFREALSSISKAEHEKSHLSESYGSIISALEEQIQKLPITRKNRNMEH